MDIIPFRKVHSLPMQNLRFIFNTTATAFASIAHCHHQVSTTTQEDKESIHKTVESWQKAAFHLKELYKLNPESTFSYEQELALNKTIESATKTKFQILHRDHTLPYKQTVFSCEDVHCIEEDHEQKILYGIAIVQHKGDELFVTELVTNPFKQSGEEIELALLLHIFKECADKGLSGVILQGNFSILSSIKHLPEDRGAFISVETLSSYLSP